jgi:hypothetical protein
VKKAGAERSSLEKRLAAYGAMSLALAAVSSPAGALAGPIAYTPTGQPWQTPAGGAIFFNPSTGSTFVTPTPGSYTALPGDYELFMEVDSPTRTLDLLQAPGGGAFAVLPASTFGVAQRLAFGDVIGPGLYFRQSFSTLASNFLSSPPGFFNLPSPGTSAEGYVGLDYTGNYGWADIVINADYTISLDAFGYDPDGASITAGAGIEAAPEPASIILLALGAAGMTAFRKKRRGPV